jgi:hypothetical protein
MPNKSPSIATSITVIKTAKCKSLSGTSTITYSVGTKPYSSLHLCIAENDGGGYFSDSWVTYVDIIKALKKAAKGKPITSVLLQSLFRGKSVNTPAFLMAVLVDVKAVKSLKGKLRHFELLDDTYLQSLLNSPKKKAAKKTCSPRHSKPKA